MEITSELIDRLSHLSMLSFSEDEKLKLQSELEKMIGFINKLEEADTSGVDPLLYITSGKKILREDKVQGEITREEAFSNATDHNNRFFTVPKVIKK